MPIKKSNANNKGYQMKIINGKKPWIAKVT